MEDCGSSKGDVLYWTDEQMDYLVQLLVEQSRIPGMKANGGLKSKAYRVMERKMIEKFGPQFTRDKIKNKLKYAKPTMNACREILKASGFGWDPTNKCVTGDTKAWSDYIQKCPGRSKYKNAKYWRYYEEFLEVYGESHATGDDNHTCNSMFMEDDSKLNLTMHVRNSPSFDLGSDEHQSVPQMLNDDSHLPSPENKQMPPHPSGSVTGNSSQRKRGRMNFDTEYYQLLTDIATNVKTIATNLRASQVSMCAQILREMRDVGEIDEDLYIKATDMFEDNNKPTAFLNIEPQRRVPWLLRKFAGNSHQQ
ncbi:unnamed protein product [Victoria cruziana]